VEAAAPSTTGGAGRDTPGLMRPQLFAQPELADHELLDSGEGEKLERFGEVVLRRPDPQALWRRGAPAGAWEAAHLVFERDPDSGGKRGRWRASPQAPDAARGTAPWTVRWNGLAFLLRPTPFKHVGLFPEQAANWSWVEALAPRLGARPRLLDLFGYTGAASLVAARAGFEVTHVDASKASLAWMGDNARASGTADGAVRIVLDDALSFARREVRRGARYDGILLDPPHHGRGPRGERWQLEEHLGALLETCARLVTERAFLVLSTYAVGLSPLAVHNLLAALGEGEVESGALALRETGAGRRFLPCGSCARWWRGLDAPRAAVARP
jgi:23S rRNA (cytosine1962-C5)-methyltransferase